MGRAGIFQFAQVWDKGSLHLDLVYVICKDARDTRASGLTVAGRYVFELTVADRSKVATREVVIAVQ